MTAKEIIWCLNENFCCINDGKHQWILPFKWHWTGWEYAPLWWPPINFWQVPVQKTNPGYDVVGCDIPNHTAGSCSSRFRRRRISVISSWSIGQSLVRVTLFDCSPVGELINRWSKKRIKCSNHSEGRKSCVIVNEGVITFQTVDSKLAVGQGNLHLFKLVQQGNTIDALPAVTCALLCILFFVRVEDRGVHIHTSLQGFVGSTTYTIPEVLTANSGCISYCISF